MPVQFTKATKIAKKGKFLVYGDTGTGKTWFALSFPRVALIDMEGGADLYGGRFDFDVMRTKSFSDVLDAIEIVKRDNRQTWDTLVIDPATVVYQVLQDASQAVAEGRAKRKGQPVDDVALSPRDWGLLKRRLYAALTDLANLGVNVVLTAHLRDVVNGQQAKIGERPDIDKKVPYWPDVLIKMTARNGRYIGVVEKDRSGTFTVGQEVEGIGYPHFANTLTWMSEGEQVSQPSEDEAVQQDARRLAVEERPILKTIRDLQAALHISDDTFVNTLGRDYGVERLEELNDKDAAALKARLEKARDTKKAA